MTIQNNNIRENEINMVELVFDANDFSVVNKNINKDLKKENFTNRSSDIIINKSKENDIDVTKIMNKGKEFIFEKVTFYDMFFREFFCLCSSQKEKMYQLDFLTDLFSRKFSFEYFTKISRKILSIEHIVFADYQRELLKYTNFQNHEKTTRTFKNLIDELELNDTLIDKNLKLYLKK